MKKFLLGLAALPFLAGLASAAEPLRDVQMDQITAGATCPDGFTNCSAGNGTISLCTGCTSGQVFTPISPQTLFKDLNSFLNSVAFKSSCSTNVC